MGGRGSYRIIRTFQIVQHTKDIRYFIVFYGTVCCLKCECCIYVSTKVSWNGGLILSVYREHECSKLRDGMESVHMFQTPVSKNVTNIASLMTCA